LTYPHIQLPILPYEFEDQSQKVPYSSFSPFIFPPDVWSAVPGEQQPQLYEYVLYMPSMLRQGFSFLWQLLFS
jgi:hypothetical protein